MIDKWGKIGEWADYKYSEEMQSDMSVHLTFSCLYTVFHCVSLSSAWWASSDSCSKTHKYDFGLGAVEGILEDQSCVLFVVVCCLITSLRALPPSSCVFVLLMSVYTILIIYSASKGPREAPAYSNRQHTVQAVGEKWENS